MEKSLNETEQNAMGNGPELSDGTAEKTEEKENEQADMPQAYLIAKFGLPQQELNRYSPLTLAHIGDAAFEIVVRTVLVRRANQQVNKLHRLASSLVSAEHQSKMVGVLEEVFTGEEAHVYKRGRNAKAATKAKNASITDYRRATGLEAVIGYLYLKGDYRRIVDLVELALERV